MKTLALFLTAIFIAGSLFTYTIFDYGIKRTYQRYLYYRFPLKYQDYILESSKEYNLDPSFVSAVIYEESRFNKDSSSHKGALGLMQILPDTAVYISRRINDKNFQQQNITDPQKNIQYGSYYLSYLFHKYGNWDKVLAAYNAGEGNVDKWTAEGDYQIKFRETISFLNNVKRSQERYKMLYFNN